MLETFSHRILRNLVSQGMPKDIFYLQLNGVINIPYFMEAELTSTMQVLLSALCNYWNS